MTILVVVGARPNFVKIAPLIREMRKRPGVSVTLVHTGQHHDWAMSEQFLRDLQIPLPDVNLGVGSGTHATQTAEVMRRLEPYVANTRPAYVLVVGDVNSTVAAALTAVKLGTRVAHVEAGLRSFDRSMPEEINRVVTDAISDLLFVTEESGRVNLLREGVAFERIHFTGNVMIDTLQAFKPQWRRSPIVSQLGLDQTPYGVVTLHRPSNVDEPTVLKPMMEALQKVASHLPLVFPVHPRARERLAGQRDLRWGHHSDSTLVAPNGLRCIEPLGYLDCIALLSRARIVLTDSGGIQEETTVLGVPCLTLRENTERPATVLYGTNRVVGTDPRTIVSEAVRVLTEPPRLARQPPLWDGHAAERIVDVLTHANRN